MTSRADRLIWSSLASDGFVLIWTPAAVLAQCVAQPPQSCEAGAPARPDSAAAGRPATPAPATAGGEPYAHDRMAPVARAVRTNATFVIDGVLDDAGWSVAPPITDLWQMTPDDGAPVSEKTEVRLLYDDDYLYVGAWLWDDERDLAPRMIRRDGVLA